MSAVSGAWSWRHAIVKSDLPSPTRHLLLTLSIRMDETGGGCYPSIAQIMEMTGLTKNTVLKHLKIAVDKGWLGQSQHGFRGQKWKRAEYVASWPGRELQGAAMDEKGLSDSVDPDQQGGAADAPPCDEKVVQEMTEGGASAGMKVVQEMHQDKNSPITTPLTSSSERERASAVVDVNGMEKEEDASPVNSAKPETAAETEKRVMRFCTGEGYQGGEWPKWTGSSLTYIKRRFADLSADDQLAAERWRDAFLAKAKAQGVKTPMPVGNYFRDHAWQTLSPTEMARALAAKDRGAGGGASAGVAEAARPEGWAVANGPVFAAFLHAVLLRGPEHRDHMSDTGMWLRVHLVKAWPKLLALHDMAAAKRGFVAPEKFHALKGAMEFVPEGCGVWTAWETEFAARGWPGFPHHDGMNGMYFPAGGPDGLAAFEALLTPQKETAA